MVWSLTTHKGQSKPVPPPVHTFIFLYCSELRKERDKTSPTAAYNPNPNPNSARHNTVMQETSNAQVKLVPNTGRMVLGLPRGRAGAQTMPATGGKAPVLAARLPTPAPRYPT